MNNALRFALPGFSLGLVLHFTGFTSYDELHAFFTLEDLRLLGTFGLGVVIAGVGFRLFTGDLSTKRVHKGVIPGSILFGFGWAVTGACPGVAFAQLGEGKLLALWTLLGIAIGNWVYGRVHGRFFRWDTGSCDV